MSKKTLREKMRSKMPYPGIWEYYREMDQKLKKRRKNRG